ncbi:hypothetical protein [Pinirhizobacter soli]|uniref:hypothetical protein n=1 Tax=Pinirhizobacter soli TaxID=2786953 RepID=UPI00202AA4CE|nr:hypothetical protein [Pinirhizobacter soli]
MSDSPTQGQEYRIACKLYSRDGKRAVDVLEFRHGEIYLDEQEWVGGTDFKNRHAGRLVGPFASTEEAERFIVGTSWFQGSTT